MTPILVEGSGLVKRFGGVGRAVARVEEEPALGGSAREDLHERPGPLPRSDKPCVVRMGDE